MCEKIIKEISVSKSIQDLGSSVIREMASLAAQEKNVINLSIGEPDFDTPEYIIEKAFSDARSGYTHYTPSQGDRQLLEKLTETVTHATGITLSPSSILVTHGGMGALTAVLRTLLEPGDEVLLVEPHFPDYMAHIAFAGGVAVKVGTSFENGFVPNLVDIERAIGAKTRVLLLNSPNNPTGAVIPGDVLDGIARIAIKHNLVVISDEVYDQIIFTRHFESIYTRPEMANRTIVIKSFSKNYAMTGWRIGYCYGPESLIQQILKVVNYSTACASSVGQRAALAALNMGSEIVEEMKERFRSRVDLVYARMENIKGVRVSKTEGSFYLFVDIHKISPDSRSFALQLFQKEKVVVVPGYAFGKSGEGCFRLACTCNKALLKEAMDRIESFINSYSR